ncbi:immune inhibitor A domain-containing protein [Plantactinospora siamensis]|uniref:Immune inhibitor A domain-containing protein n=1 Tax=Plantactinospora siamensis TaxID=555372 RepID=A0ABV6NVS2_9ACTN
MGLLGLSLTATGVAMGPSASAAPAIKAKAVAPAAADAAPPSDELPNPLEDKRRALRQEGLTDVLNGQAKPVEKNGSTVVKVGKTAGAGPAGNAGARTLAAGKQKDQYVELAREKTDHIFVILTDFGNERDPRFPDQDTNPNIPGPTKFDGPLNNQIPAPNRAVDNTTVWQPNYDADHYRQLYFGKGKGVESVKTYYETQSSGRYSVDGEVTDWVRVKYNEARYGRSSDDVPDAKPGVPPKPGDDPNVCDSHVCNNTWDLVRDAANQWVADQKARGRTDAQIAADMKQFDQWDRYDYDGDGNFNEPDGYIDHFQIVHAGGDEADGDPVQGEDAIWSHRWYAYGTDVNKTGPANNKLGGTQIGNTGMWIGDYTIQPENGGLSVFVHEYGHDLGLPDDYDTSGAGDNPVEHWSLMAQSRLNAKEDQALGTRPGDIGAWQKLQLGWLDYETVKAGKEKTLDLGPQEYNSPKAQAAVVVLPKKSVTTDLGAPFAGTKQYFSGNADNLNNTMTREFDLTGKTSASLSAKVRYNIEKGYDYMYLEASADGGQNWTALDGTVDGKAFDKDASGTPALDDSTEGKWVDLNVPMNAYAGKKVQFRFHYVTDGGFSAGGFFADNITVTADGATVLSDGAEAATTWALKGFSIVGSSVTKLYDNYYIAGNRSYVSYDKYLKTGPYYFGYMNSRPDYVDHFPYQQGLLISYWDTSQVDNNVSDHPGQGRNLYIDAHPDTMYNLTGNPWRTRVQIYDAPFSKLKADSFTLHINGQPQYIRGQAAQPLFDDTRNYFDPDLPNHGVKVAGAGVKIKVVQQNGTSMKVKFFS